MNILENNLKNKELSQDKIKVAAEKRAEFDTGLAAQYTALCGQASLLNFTASNI